MRWYECSPPTIVATLPVSGILGDVRVRVRGHDQDAGGRVAVVADLVPALGPARERHDVALAEHAIAVVHPHRRLAAQDDEELLRSVVEVVDEL